MQTHEDMAHINLESAFLKKLKQRATEAENRGDGTITAGKPGEVALAVWDYGTMRVRHMPPDEQGILRISIGGGHTPIPLDYCTFRGDRGQCIALLEKALEALKTES